MEQHDGIFGSGSGPVEGNDGMGPAPGAAAGGEPCGCCRSLREQLRAVEELAEKHRWAAVRARAELGGLRSAFDRRGARLEALVAENKELRRTAKNALFYKSEAERLRNLLSETGVDTSRRSTMASLRMEAGSLRREKAGLIRQLAEKDRQLAEKDARIAELRSSRTSLAKHRFNGRSERQEKQGSERGRGQQPGSAGHGRTERPALEKKEERHDPPKGECTCSICGTPYVANGALSSEVIEIEARPTRA